MPSRVIRGCFNTSESMAEVSLFAELLFAKLILAVDDYGRTDARPRVLRGLLFSMRDDVKTTDISLWLDELCCGETAPIIKYTVDDKPYIQLLNWEKHRSNAKRGLKSRWPAPTYDIPTDPHGSPRIPEDAPGSPPEVAGLRGDEGTGGRGELKYICETPLTDSGAPAKRKSKPKKPPELPFPDGTEKEIFTRLYPWCERKKLNLEIDLKATIESISLHAGANGTTAANWDKKIQTWVNSKYACVVKGKTPKPFTAEEIAAMKRFQAEGEAKEAARIAANKSAKPTLDPSSLFLSPPGDSNA